MDPNAPQYRRFITVQDEATGKSAFSTQPEILHQMPLPGGAVFTLDFAIDTIPVALPQPNGEDAALSRPDLPMPGSTTAGGVVLRHVALQPGQSSPMHKTQTAEFVVLVDGELELALESGEVRTMGRGDTVVQRGTMHSWRNVSQTEWATMVAMVMPLASGEEDVATKQ